MTSKEQERKALEQIKTIIESMGKDSYIAIAFAGCVEDAEENIENDFALSMKNRYETNEKQNKALTLTLVESERKVKDLEAHLKESHELSDSLAHKLEDEKAKRKEIEVHSIDCWNKLQDAESKLDEKEDEIIRLKAKLYDLLVK